MLPNPPKFLIYLIVFVDFCVFLTLVGVIKDIIRFW